MEHLAPAVIYTVFDVLYFVIRVYWAGKADQRPVKETKSFALDKLNIGLVGIFTMVVPLVALYTRWLDRFDYPETLAVPLSIPVLLAGLVVFWLAHRDLAENWSVTLELKEGHSLVTTGIYRRIRHPMYTAIWLCAIGQALCVPNWIGGLGGLAAWTLLYSVRIGKEERMMLEKFGDEYRAYMARTGRLTPFV
jgi:protein-S-isoprenylcysteine O-methyltransferase Ste14